jgi:hypothetical protein
MSYQEHNKISKPMSYRELLDDEELDICTHSLALDDNDLPDIVFSKWTIEDFKQLFNDHLDDNSDQYYQFDSYEFDKFKFRYLDDPDRYYEINSIAGFELDERRKIHKAETFKTDIENLLLFAESKLTHIFAECKTFCTEWLSDCETIQYDCLFDYSASELVAAYQKLSDDEERKLFKKAMNDLVDEETETEVLAMIAKQN